MSTKPLKENLREGRITALKLFTNIVRIECEVVGDDLSDRQTAVNHLESILGKLPGVISTRQTVTEGCREAKIRLELNKGAATDEIKLAAIRETVEEHVVLKKDHDSNLSAA